ncbi:hypothetical protein HQ560_09305 [bacterium]|nr:hypothetical protein [bacterium]
MPITFKCACGKKLRAPDGSSGKQTRCPVCQEVVTIPDSDLHFAADELPETLPDGRDNEELTCPGCHLQVESDAVLCINCGARLREPLPGAGPRVVLPVKGIVIGASTVAVLLGLWFFVAAPFMTAMRFDSAQAKFVNGDLAEAKAEFENIRGKMDAKRQKLCDLRINQLTLEMEKNAGKILSTGDLVSSPTLDFSVARTSSRGGALLFEVTVKNMGREPLTLHRDFVYVRGMSHTIFVSNHTSNTIDDVTIAPGKAEAATIVFRAEPRFPVQRKVGRGSTQPTFYIMLNTGDDYVKRMWPF